MTATQAPVRRLPNGEIPGWFLDHAKAKVGDLIERYAIRSVVEVGCWLGHSTAWFAHRVDCVTCVDTWMETEDDISPNNLVWTLNQLNMTRDFLWAFVENMREEGVWDKLTIVRGRSHDVADQVGEADLVYIDADHTYEGCAGDIVAYLPKARKIICGDDYVVRNSFGVIRAVDEMVPNRQVESPFWWAPVGGFCA